jgi:general secretion pathway protein L
VAIPQPDEETYVTLFAPATDVLFTEVNIPSRNRRQLLTAVPFALEDQLMEDIDGMHFALGPTSEHGTTSVATVARSRLESWLSGLREHGIELDAVYSEAQVLPLAPASWTLLQLDNRCALRTSTSSAYGLDCANVARFIERLTGNEESLPEKIQVITCADNNTAQDDIVGAVPLTIQREQCPGDALACLIEGCQQSPAINLLQGQYARSQPVFTGWRRWLPAVAMLLLWLGLQFGAVIGANVKLSAEEQRLGGKIVSLYKQAVPGAKKIVNARVQMQQQLDALRGGGGNSSFLDLLARGGEVFSKTSAVELGSINYRDGSMDIALTLKDIQGLDNIKQSLIEQLGVEVDIQSATPKDKIIEARLRIRRKP